MSLSRGTSSKVEPKSVPLVVSQSNESINTSSPPRLSPKVHHAGAPDTPDGRAHSRSNSLIESQHIQQDLKSCGELTFSSDNGGAPVLKGGSFSKLVEWILASPTMEDKAVLNFVVGYRQWRPPVQLWKKIMEMYGSVASII